MEIKTFVSRRKRSLEKQTFEFIFLQFCFVCLSVIRSDYSRVDEIK